MLPPQHHIAYLLLPLSTYLLSNHSSNLSYTYYERTVSTARCAASFGFLRCFHMYIDCHQPTTLRSILPTVSLSGANSWSNVEKQRANLCCSHICFKRSPLIRRRNRLYLQPRCSQSTGRVARPLPQKGVLCNFPSTKPNPEDITLALRYLQRTN